MEALQGYEDSPDASVMEEGGDVEAPEPEPRRTQGPSSFKAVRVLVSIMQETGEWAARSGREKGQVVKGRLQ